MAVSPARQETAPNLVQVFSLAELREKGSKVIKVGRKQILLWHSEKGIFACNNRCPHEGYPLKEGTMSDGCILTCNWHNWKFDLENGDTLVGGDKLRRYPVQLRGDEIWLDVSDPPGAERAAAALDNLKDSFRRLEFDRMAREIARLSAADADPLDAVRAAFTWTHDRLEYGATHAQAAAPDWLALRQEFAGDEADQLVPLVEIVGHLAYDSLREQAYPFPQEVSPYNEDAFVQAIEGEDETATIALLRGALKAGLGFGELEPALARAALAHYEDFGHAAIYVHKTGQLIDHIGAQSAKPLLLALVRSLCYAFREDLIPEFRSYAHNLGALTAKLADSPKGTIAAEDFHGLSAKQAMALCVSSGASRQSLFDALLGTAAWNMLHFDQSFEQRYDRPVSDNVGWLDFTHAITFAEVVKALCEKQPSLWPQGLLQMACFAGRNSGYVDGDQDVSPWRVPDADAFFTQAGQGLFDHGLFEHIVSCHLMKTWAAARTLAASDPKAAWVPDLTAALKRFFNSPIKRRHGRRTARQSITFVALEG